VHGTGVVGHEAGHRPEAGEELVRGEAGNNPHTLVADPGTCHLTTALSDPEGLGLAMIENTAPVYLIHPEHGGTGVAPGSWLVRRQRELALRRPVPGHFGSLPAHTGSVLIAD